MLRMGLRWQPETKTCGEGQHKGAAVFVGCQSGRAWPRKDRFPASRAGARSVTPATLAANMAFSFPAWRRTLATDVAPATLAAKVAAELPSQVSFVHVGCQSCRLLLCRQQPEGAAPRPPIGRCCAGALANVCGGQRMRGNSRWPRRSATF
jgi:hypothetical protein